MWMIDVSSSLTRNVIGVPLHGMSAALPPTPAGLPWAPLLNRNLTPSAYRLQFHLCSATLMMLQTRWGQEQPWPSGRRSLNKPASPLTLAGSPCISWPLGIVCSPGSPKFLSLRLLDKCVMNQQSILFSSCFPLKKSAIVSNCFLYQIKPAGSFPGGTSDKELTCQCRRHKKCGFHPWVGKIPWRRAWQPTPVFLPG